MKQLKHTEDPKAYTGIAFIGNLAWLDSQIIIVAPTMGKLKKFYRDVVGKGCLVGAECDPTRCARVTVTKHGVKL
jgi:hypothetical protein